MIELVITDDPFFDHAGHDWLTDTILHHDSHGYAELYCNEMLTVIVQCNGIEFVAGAATDVARESDDVRRSTAADASVHFPSRRAGVQCDTFVIAKI